MDDQLEDQNPPATDEGHDGNTAYTDEQYVNPALSTRAKPEASELNSRKLITELAALLEKSTKILAELQRAPSGSRLAEMVERARSELKSFVLGNGHEVCTILSDSNGHTDLYAVVPMSAGMELVLCSSLYHGDVFIVQPNEIQMNPADHWKEKSTTNENPFIMQGKYQSNQTTNALTIGNYPNIISVARRMVDLKLEKLAAMVDKATRDLQIWLTDPQLVTYETTVTKKMGIIRHASIFLLDNKVLVICSTRNAEDVYFIANKDREKRCPQTYSEWDWLEECCQTLQYSYILRMPAILYAGKYLNENGFEPVAEFMRGDGEEHLLVMLFIAKKVLKNYIMNATETRHTQRDEEGSNFLGASISMKGDYLLTVCSSHKHQNPYVLRQKAADPGFVETWSMQQHSGNYEFSQNTRNFRNIATELQRATGISE